MIINMIESVSEVLEVPKREIDYSVFGLIVRKRKVTKN